MSPCESFGTFGEASLADWFAKEGCGQLLTQNFGFSRIKFRQRLAIGQDRNVTCEAFGTFTEALLADWSPKERCGKLLTRNFRFRCSKQRERLAIGQNTDVTLRIIRNIRGSIVSGLVPERKVRETWKR